MINKPNWLPDIISFSDYNSNWKKYLEELFKIFKNDFIDSKPFYNNKPILFDNRLVDKYPACFLHLITEDKIKNYNRVDIQNVSLLRCERLCWIRPIIENHTDEIISVWENMRSRKLNTIFFIEKFDYVVILTNVKDRFYLVTAYYINYPLRKKQIIKERDEWLNMQKPLQEGTV